MAQQVVLNGLDLIHGNLNLYFIFLYFQHLNITTVAGDDYIAITGEQLVFPRGSTRVCHTITIMDDDICESDPNENFFYNLAYVSGTQPISIAPMTALLIVDDTTEQECEYNHCCK